MASSVTSHSPSRSPITRQWPSPAPPASEITLQTWYFLQAPPPPPASNRAAASLPHTLPAFWAPTAQGFFHPSARVFCLKHSSFLHPFLQPHYLTLSLLRSHVSSTSSRKPPLLSYPGAGSEAFSGDSKTSSWHLLHCITLVCLWACLP